MNEERRYMAPAVVSEAVFPATTFPPVTMQMIDDDYRDPRQARKARKVRPARPGLRMGFSRRPAMVLAGVAAVVVFGAGAYFLPKAVTAMTATGRLESEASRLSAAYEQCAKDLKGKADTVDTYTQSAVDTYNKEVAECERLGKEKKKTVDELNKLYGE